VVDKTAAELARERGDVIDDDNPAGEFEGEDEEEKKDEEEPVLEAEGEEGEEAEGEEEDEPGDTPDEGPAGKDEAITIPKARFDEAQRKARERQAALETRIAEMESRSARETAGTDLSVLEAEVEELNTQFEDLLLEGEADKARKVRRERDAKQNAMFDMRLAQTSRATSQAAVEQMRFDAQLAQFEAKFPAINPDSNDFNQEITNEVNEMFTVYKAAGWTETAALNKAVHYVIGEDTPAMGEDPEIVRSKRGQLGRKRVSKAVKKSPPSLQDKGRDSDKGGTNDGLPDVTRMSPEEFAKLSAKELAKIRGDQLSEEEAA